MYRKAKVQSSNLFEFKIKSPHIHCNYMPTLDITLMTNKTIKLKLKLFIPKPELEVFKYRGPTCPIKSNIVE